MKASSVGLETFVKMSQEELDTLKEKPLTGIIKFSDNAGFPNRNIPFSIEYVISQNRMLEVKQKPDDDYFGSADEVNFFINQDYYQSLIDIAICGERFFTVGKLIVVIEGRYIPY